MKGIIPFINGTSDATLARRLYADATLWRVPAYKRDLVNACRDRPLWVDTAVDGIHLRLQDSQTDDTWNTYLSRVKNHRELTSKRFLSKPDDAVVRDFVASLFAQVQEVALPVWITVPQLPMMGDASRNKINTKLATCAADLRHLVSRQAKLVLPVIVTKPGQIRGKTQRKPKIAAVMRSLQASGASAIWIAHVALDDMKPSSPLERRIDDLVGFHQELMDAVESEIRVVAGPYWAANLVLWVRGLASELAVSVGSGFRYYISGGRLSMGRPRIAINVIRRCVTRNRALRSWIDHAIDALAVDDPARSDLESLRRLFDVLEERERARRQVAESYQSWIRSLATIPPSGRAVALFKHFTSAYAVGRSLPMLPREEAPGRRPEALAKYVMPNCL